MDGLYLFLAFFIFAATCCYMVHRVTALFAEPPESTNTAALFDGLAKLNHRLDVRQQSEWDARQRTKNGKPTFGVVRDEPEPSG